MSISFKVVPLQDYDDAELYIKWMKGGLDDTGKRFVQLLANCGLVFHENHDTFNPPRPCFDDSDFDQNCITFVVYSVKTTRLFLESAFDALPKEDRCGFESIVHAVAEILT